MVKLSFSHSPSGALSISGYFLNGELGEKTREIYFDMFLSLHKSKRCTYLVSFLDYVQTISNDCVSEIHLDYLNDTKI